VITKVRPKADQYISEIAKDFGSLEFKKEARELLKAVLHAVRDNITQEYSIDILTQLPPFLKEIYVENWKPSQCPDYIQENLNLLEEVKKRLPADPFTKTSRVNLDKKIAIVLIKLSTTITWNPPDFLKNLIPDSDQESGYIQRRNVLQ